MSLPILDWSEAHEVGPARVGGKAWHLALLAQMGLPVPVGFVIEASESIGRRRGAGPTDSLRTALVQTLDARGWNQQPLAVRSSAVQEDSARASFAGVFRTELNVCGSNALLQAITAVWDSVDTAQAIAYRNGLGLSDQDAAMAVLIMPLLPAQASGVAFTCDPASGREDQLVIHATWGLGEALVSGQIQPDEYRLQTMYPSDELKLIDRRVGDKRRITVPAQGGGTSLRDMAGPQISAPTLTDEQALSLARLVREAANVLDYAQPLYDMEWVWDGTGFWIVQARPVTIHARYTYPPLLQQPSLWSRANARDVMPDPLSPMDWSLVRGLLNRMVSVGLERSGYPMLPGLQRLALRQGRLYYETSILQWEAFDAFDAHPQAYNRLLGGHQPEITVPKPTAWQHLLRFQRGARFLIKCTRPRMRAAAVIAQVHQQAAALRTEELPTRGSELAHRLREHLDRVRGADELFLLQVAGSFLFVLMDGLERFAPGEGHGIAAALMSGGKPSVTAEQAYELMQLAQIAAADPPALQWLRSSRRNAAAWSRELAPDSNFRSAFARFLERYGHRGVYETYLRNPRWRESPGYLFDSIIGLLGSDSAAIAQRQARVVGAARKRAAAVVPLWRRPFIPLFVKLATVERNVREAGRSALMAQLEILRRYALVIAQELAKTASTGDSADIFNLTFPELLALADGRLSAEISIRRIQRRREQLQGYFSQTATEVIVEHAQQTAAIFPRKEPRSDCSGDLWQGVAVGTGFATGLAHVAHHPNEALAMERGAILVAPSTDPAWTPLFLKAGGLVMETGGYMSHGAIVAREFGIPAVVNVPGILNRVKDRDTIEVDGARGTVRLYGTSSSPSVR